jgi:uncharacterized membrane protein
MDTSFLVLIVVVLAWLGRRRVKRLESRVSELRERLDAAIAEMNDAKAGSAVAVTDGPPALGAAAEPPTQEAMVAAPFAPAEKIEAVPSAGALAGGPAGPTVVAALGGEGQPPQESATEPEPAESLAASPPITPLTPEVAISAASPKPRSIEERLGAHWTVWIGGLALALGAVLLVRYSIERGYFGPGMRIALGALLAILLIGAGEYLRRKDEARDGPHLDRPHQDSDVAGAGALAEAAGPQTPGPFAVPYIPGVLTAAGTIAAFATIYAAHAVYGFIGPVPAFIGLAMVALATMAAAMLHGPALAGLGLVGALATPLFVASQSRSLWPVVAYDFVVVAAAYGLARLKRWVWLALAAGCGAGLWALPFIAEIDLAHRNVHLNAGLAHISLQMALAAYVLAIRPHRGTPDGQAYMDPVAHSILGLFAILAILALGVASPWHFGLSWILGAALFVAILGVTGIATASASGAAFMGAVVLVAALCLWPPVPMATPSSLGLPMSNAGGLPLWVRALIAGLAPFEPLRFAIFGSGASLVLALAAGWRLLRGTELNLPAAGPYAATASLAPLCFVAIAYLRFAQHAASLPLAFVALLLGVVFALAGSLFMREVRAWQSPAMRLGLGAMAASSIAAVSLGLVFGLDRGMLTVALALAAFGTAYVAMRLDLTALRWCVAALGVIIAARLFYDPRIVGSELSRTPIFNWLLFGYGVPAVAFGLAGHVLRRVRDDIPARVTDALAVLFSALLFFFEIRHAINHGDPFAPASGLIEQGLLAVTSIGFSLVLTRLDAARENIVFRCASLVAGGLALIFAAVGLGIGYNPLFDATPLEGGRLVNALSLAYLAPSAMAGALAFSARKLRPGWYWGAAALLALLLGYAFLIMEVRALFHGQIIIVELGAGIAELGVDAAISLAIATLFTSWAKSELAPWMKAGSVAFGTIGAAIFLLGPLTLANPLFGETRATGGPLLNTLLVGYALVSLVCVVLARRVRSLRWLRYASLVSFGAIICLFAYVSLEVRRVFRGEDAMDLLRGFTQDELYAYSAAWLVLGILLLAYGIWRGSREARLASACFIVAAAVKVFLIDLSGLEGILRALSFIGLGAVLIGVGLVYQKFVFARPSDEKPAS